MLTQQRFCCEQTKKTEPSPKADNADMGSVEKRENTPK